MDQYYVSKIYKHIICSEVNDMFLWFPPPTKASWHNARESTESSGTIKLKNLNGYLSNHKVVCRCDFRPHV